MALVTLNYKWSLTFQAKTHNYNIIPMMHCHWQATPPSPGFALPTNLCSVLSFPSIMLSPSSQSLKWSILRTLPSFALSIFLAWPLSSNTVSCYLPATPPTPSASPLSGSLCKRKYPSAIPEHCPPSAVPLSFAASFSHFVLSAAHIQPIRFSALLFLQWPCILSNLITSLHAFL